MPRADIDTDAMVPQRWLITTEREGLGEGLFSNWRYPEPEGPPDPQFVLNRSRYADARIIVAGPNYGCGSSREHAVWAHLDYGIDAVIAPSFGPIFRDNAFKNGLLAITADEGLVADILRQLESERTPHMEIDLRSCTITAPDETVSQFVIDEVIRDALLSGRDEIANTLAFLDEIEKFQDRDRTSHPFIWPPRK